MSTDLLPTRRLVWSAQTDRGRVRPNNEDSFLGLCFDALEIQYLGKTGAAPLQDVDFVFAVSDGMGGAHAGEFASRIAVDKITRLLPRSFRMGASGLETGFVDILAELFDQIHRAVRFLGDSDEECSGMETTLTLCWLTPRWALFGHIGDSRLYYLPKTGGLKQLSHDDTYVGWMFRNGQINEREARTHPQRTALQKALGGTHQFVTPQLGAVAYEAGDRFLLCSDGLNEGLYDYQIEEMLREEPGPDAARKLVAASVENSGRDNTTALVIEIAE
jgi:protein phosphatase